MDSDLTRHSQKQKELERTISDLEVQLLKDPSDKFVESSLRVYRTFFNKLMDSKAEVVSKLGRK